MDGTPGTTTWRTYMRDAASMQPPWQRGTGRCHALRLLPLARLHIQQQQQLRGNSHRPGPPNRSGNEATCSTPPKYLLGEVDATKAARTTAGDFNEQSTVSCTRTPPPAQAHCVHRALQKPPHSVPWSPVGTAAPLTRNERRAPCRLLPAHVAPPQLDEGPRTAGCVERNHCA